MISTWGASAKQERKPELSGLVAEIHQRWPRAARSLMEAENRAFGNSCSYVKTKELCFRNR